MHLVKKGRKKFTIKIRCSFPKAAAGIPSLLRNLPEIFYAYTSYRYVVFLLFFWLMGTYNTYYFGTLLFPS